MVLTTGTLFRHARILDPDWTPGPGQRYSDAPHAVCRVTTIRRGRVYYRIGDDPGPSHAHFPVDRTADHVGRIIE